LLRKRDLLLSISGVGETLAGALGMPGGDDLSSRSNLRRRSCVDRAATTRRFAEVLDGIGETCPECPPDDN
jgi:hypothetical protein